MVLQLGERYGLLLKQPGFRLIHRAAVLIILVPTFRHSLLFFMVFSATTIDVGDKFEQLVLLSSTFSIV